MSVHIIFIVRVLLGSFTILTILGVLFLLCLVISCSISCSVCCVMCSSILVIMSVLCAISCGVSVGLRLSVSNLFASVISLFMSSSLSVVIEYPVCVCINPVKAILLVYNILATSVFGVVSVGLMYLSVILCSVVLKGRVVGRDMVGGVGKNKKEMEMISRK